MSVRIALPEPTSFDPAYNEQSLPPYISSLIAAGAEPILIPVHTQQSDVARILTSCQGVLLPGSKADVNPALYNQSQHPQAAAPDPLREAVDELLIQDAFNLGKPILGICFGTQKLNVWRNGSLVQHLETAVDHSPGSGVAEAHRVHIEPHTLLSTIAATADDFDPATSTAPVNSTHHQAILQPGDGLVVSARSSQDSVVEAVELPGPFMLAVQWHPERIYQTSAFARAIFHAFVQAAATYHPRPIETSVAG